MTKANIFRLPVYIIAIILISIIFYSSLAFGQGYNIHEDFDHSVLLKADGGLWDEVVQTGNLLSLSSDVFFTAPGALAVKLNSGNNAYVRKAITPAIKDKLNIQFRMRLDGKLTAAPTFYVLSIFDENGKAFIHLRSTFKGKKQRVLQLDWRNGDGIWTVGKNSISIPVDANAWDQLELIVTLRSMGSIRLRFNNNKKYANKIYTDFESISIGAVALGHLGHATEAKGTYYIDEVFIGEDIMDRYKKGKISYTFDDGLKSQFVVIRPLLMNRGLRATMYLISQKVDKEGFLNTGQIKGLILDGFDIGSHSVTHTPLTLISPREIEHEIADSKAELASAFDIKPQTFSYPFGKFNDIVVKKTLEHYALGLTVNFRMNFFNRPSDLKGGGRINRLDTAYTDFSLKELKILVDQAEAEGLWLIFAFHGLGSKQMTVRKFRELLDYVSTKDLEVVTIKAGLKTATVLGRK